MDIHISYKISQGAFRIRNPVLDSFAQKCSRPNFSAHLIFFLHSFEGEEKIG